MTEFVRKNITLPVELAKMLEKEENASRLIRDLLADYYSLNTEKQEVKQQLEELEKEKSALRAKLERIEEREAQKDLELYEYADYYKKKREEWDDERRKEWLKESAENLNMTVDNLRSELETMAGNRGGGR